MKKQEPPKPKAVGVMSEPAREGANDHIEKAYSRRPDGLHKHRPPMLMASKVRGGESAR